MINQLPPNKRNYCRISGNLKRGNEISSSSYGSGKKTLGVPRYGNVSGLFKPPIASKNQALELQPDPYALSDPASENLKHLDPKMVELIKSEIMDHGAQVEWSDIAGLDFVKKTVGEIVVLPIIRPDIFKGLRGPPKGLLLFGPPGTGKTLIGESQETSIWLSQTSSKYANLSVLTAC